jgi:hypothetical protein
MAHIEISSLKPAGSDLFANADSFLTELTETDTTQIRGSGSKKGGGTTIFYAGGYGGYGGYGYGGYGYGGYGYGGYRGYGGYGGYGGYRGGYGGYGGGIFYASGGHGED